MTTLTQAHTINDFLQVNVDKYKASTAFACQGQSLTYQALDSQSKILASWLQNQPELEQGDRIAIQLPNALAYPIAVYAAFRAGFVLVNTNPLYTPREMLHQFTDAGVKAIFVLDALIPKLSAIIGDTQISHVISIGGNVEADKLAAAAKVSCSSLTTLLDAPVPEALAPLKPIDENDVALLQYTGGTTGVSKGASLSHKNILSNVNQIAEHFGNKLEENKESFVCPLPLYHIYAFTVNLLYVGSIGGKNILISNPQNPDEFVDSMTGENFTAFTGINTLFVGLSQYPPFKALNFDSLRLTISGGTTLTQDAAAKWLAVTNCTITEGYGLSETSPVACFNKPGEEELGTVGHPLPQTQVELRDENNQTVADGQEGEIVIKGPQVMLGYWQREDENQKVFTEDGFFKTGDVGVFQPSGTLKIVDRLKDMILVSGFNVYPNEIEDVLTRHEAISEAAVVGKPHEKTGEAIWAYITVSQDISTDEIIAYCREQLTPYKVPKNIEILAELPKSSVGKVLRKELRD